MKVTRVPCSTGTPALSLTVAIMAEELVPSGGMVPGFEISAIVPVVPPMFTVIDCVTVLVPIVADAVILVVPVVVPAIKETVTIPLVFWMGTVTFET